MNETAEQFRESHCEKGSVIFKQKTYLFHIPYLSYKNKLKNKKYKLICVKNNKNSSPSAKYAKQEEEWYAYSESVVRVKMST
ncbi:hypothetical protein ABIC15_001799 [Exiguobacterium sp. PvP048]